MHHLQKSEYGLYMMTMLVIIGGIITLSNIHGKGTVIVVGNLLYIPIAGSTLILSIIIAQMFRGEGDIGKAWIYFSICATLWFIAEMTWIIEELVLITDPFPSYADFFYILGYVFYLAFSIHYIKPLKKSITKKILLSVSTSSILFVIIALYFVVDSNTDFIDYAVVIGAVYPILDSIVMIPAMIGTILLFNGRMQFTLSLLLVGIAFMALGDIGFLFHEEDDSYYTGHPLEIMFYSAYVFFSFGIFDQIRIFRKTGNKSTVTYNRK